MWDSVGAWRRCGRECVVTRRCLPQVLEVEQKKCRYFRLCLVEVTMVVVVALLLVCEPTPNEHSRGSHNGLRDVANTLKMTRNQQCPYLTLPHWNHDGKPEAFPHDGKQVCNEDQLWLYPLCSNLSLAQKISHRLLLPRQHNDGCDQHECSWWDMDQKENLVATLDQIYCLNTDSTPPEKF